jgi:hypothetical protein
MLAGVTSIGPVVLIVSGWARHPVVRGQWRGWFVHVPQASDRGCGNGNVSSRRILRMRSLIAQLIDAFDDPNEASNPRNGIVIRDARAYRNR